MTTRHGQNVRHVRRALLATVAAAATVGSLLGLARLEATLSQARHRSAQAAAAARLNEDLERLSRDLQMTGHNAASSPRLIAAVRADVTASTLRDIFDNEPWWQPYREAFATQALVQTEAHEVAYNGPPLDAPLVLDLAKQARTTGEAVAKLAPLGPVPMEVVAAPLAIPDKVVAPVLILARPLGVVTLARLATSFGGAVGVLRHGKLVTATGASAWVKALRDRPMDDLSANDLGSGLSLVARAPDATLDRRWSLALALARVAATVLGSLLVALALLTRRKAAPSTAWATDDATARYVLINKLGSGGMADVYLAVARGEQGFRRPCVVKRLRSELADNPTLVAQFTDEATLASSLIHSNIIPIFDFGRFGDQYFIVQEYVAGRDLGKIGDRLQGQGRRPLPPEAAAYAGCAVLDALEYAHNKHDIDGKPMGLVHRDVTPENIIVSTQGEVKLLDFGVLKAKAGRSTKTEMGALKGSVSFMAPEQARCGDVDGRADLYSLALVLYFCVTGEALFEGTTSYQILVKAGAGIGPDEERRLQALPPLLGAILRRALSPRADDRFQTAAEFAAALKPLAAGGAALLKQAVTELFGAELEQEQELLREGLRRTDRDLQAPHEADTRVRPRTGTLTDTRRLPVLSARGQ